MIMDSVTKRILETLKPYTENAEISVEPGGKTNLVWLDAKNNVGFEVFDNEIIVFYLTDHQHFEDYICGLEDGQDDYIKRAEDFILDLFRYKIRYVKTFRGKILTKEKFSIIYSDGREERLQSIWHGLAFGRKSEVSTVWRYDAEKGCFTEKPAKPIDESAIEVIDVNDECFIEIFEDNGVYTYVMTVMEFDDYNNEYYWCPSFSTLPSGFYDTKEKAIEYAMEAVKNQLSH